MDILVQVLPILLKSKLLVGAGNMDESNIEANTTVNLFHGSLRRMKISKSGWPKNMYDTKI